MPAKRDLRVNVCGDGRSLKSCPRESVRERYPVAFMLGLCQLSAIATKFMAQTGAWDNPWLAGSSLCTPAN